MTRKILLIVSAIATLIPGLGMSFMPAGYAARLMVEPMTPAVITWVQFCGTNLLAIGILNLLACTSSWSPAVRAILLSNAIFHLAALIATEIAFAQGILTSSAMIEARIVHLAFIALFSLFTFKKSLQ